MADTADFELDLRWWDAANYLTVAQIYLRSNPLLRQPLTVEDIKPRLLGHWGTSPGLSLVYVAMNRLIRETGQDALYVTGPGHGGPALVANAYLEGTYSEVYPGVSADLTGLTTPRPPVLHPRRHPQPRQRPDARQHPRGRRARATPWCTPPARPSTTPTCSSRAWSATARPRPARWRPPGRIPAFLNARRDGAVLPILHLNGYKIAGPTVLGRTSDEDVRAYLSGQGWDPVVVAGDDPAAVLQELYGRGARRPRADPRDPGGCAIRDGDP